MAFGESSPNGYEALFFTEADAEENGLSATELDQCDGVSAMEDRSGLGDLACRVLEVLRSGAKGGWVTRHYSYIGCIPAGCAVCKEIVSE